ncbi:MULTISPECIES: hypothetical protein [Nocardioides]|uniref:Transposase n=1 Tax=Nocardioides vastitatis TaxID=2568655 RepID=A0ABW0ZIU1_9ACTN|nr:hypothetical protein [Nocardioides sp.]THJ11330.1 hypothetical protein E7Z54_02385 [Nocardioides sp.]
MSEDDQLLEIADELYALSLAEFTPARDKRAKELKGTPLAARVKALRKPSTAAWVVDLLVRREAAQVDQVLNVGAALREAQQAMSAGELRTLTKQRRQVTAAVTTQARRLAAEEGMRVTESVAEQVEATLTAAMVDEECGRAVRSGLLVSALATTGVEPMEPAELAASLAVPEALGYQAVPREAPRPGPPDLHVVPDPDKDAKVRAAAQERLAAATEEYDDAFAAQQEAATEVDNLSARALQLQAEIDELRRRLSDLEQQAETVEEELSEAEDARDEAAAELRTATAERDAAQAALDRLAAPRT